ncbi:MAG TPA: hypothetical protein VF121_12140 [Thermoanaerobaculia bacterium]|nr:hypothetical protein [Thermoanaerobaculia bacterium]
MKQSFAALRLLLLLAAVLVGALSLASSESEAAKCSTFCGTQGPIPCEYPCRRPE